jgi:putative ABC transport system permease protein
VHLDARVMLFALGLSVLTGLLFGALPAWRAAALDPQKSLRDGTRTTEGRSGRAVRNALVAFESALGAMLLIVAGLLAGSFFSLLGVDKGFDTDRLVATHLTLPANLASDQKQRDAFFRDVLAGLAAVPGVVRAGLVSTLPLQGEDWVDLVRKQGDTRPATELPPANYRFCSPGYFEAAGIRFLEGGPFTEADRDRRLVVIGETMARMLWPEEKAVGKTFSRGTEDEAPFEVAGVVRDVSVALDRQPVVTVYAPYWSRNERSGMNVVLRSAADPRAVARSVRKAVWSVNRDTVVGDVRTLDSVVAESVAVRRFQVVLTAAFAASALLLACVGIYGVVSWSAARRRNEIGVRMALGAPSGSVRWMIVAQGLRPVVAGLAAGVAAALALGRLLNSLLFGVTARDPLTFALVAGLLAGVAAVACYVPARRATLADPLRALRYE